MTISDFVTGMIQGPLYNLIIFQELKGVSLVGGR